MTAAPLDVHVTDLRPPAELVSPWGTRPRRGPGGLYVEAETGRAASLPGWWDEFVRHAERGRPRWSVSPAGRAFLLDGDRIGLRFRVAGRWSAGHVAAAGDLAGVELVAGVTHGEAVRAVEDWAMARAAARAGAVDVDGRLRSRQ